MSTSRGITDHFLLNVLHWANGGTDPNAGSGRSAPVGSWYQESGANPTTQVAVHLKLFGDDKGWVKQNLVNLNVFRITDPTYGAVGDGVTDDTVAIQAAINAANAAGGGIVYFPPTANFYLITRQGGASGAACVMLDNVHNVSLRGDGFSSKVGIVDANANSLSGFLVTDGATEIDFRNFQIDGSGISVAGPSNPAPNKDLIRILGDTTDANTGTGRVRVEEMYWGSTPGCRVSVIGNDLAHAPSRVSYRYNLSSANCFYGFAVGQNQTTPTFADIVFCEYNWFSSTTGSYGYGLLIADNGNRFSGRGNITNNSSGSGIALRGTRGETVWNIVNNGGAIWANDANAKRPIIRGNVILSPSGDNAASETHAIAYGSSMARLDAQIIGNVVLMTGNQTNSIPICPNGQHSAGILISDNVVSVTNPASQNGVILTTADTDEAVCIGNICLQTTNAAATGIGVHALLTSVSVDALVITGNLCIATGANNMSAGCLYRLNGAGGLGNNVIMSYNFVNNSDTGISFSKNSTQAWNNWRGCTGNLISSPGTNTITFPGGTTTPGISAEGPASLASQIAAVATNAPNTQVTAPTGSLVASTNGGQAVSLQYKESGTGSSGWFGIGGFNFFFGAVNGSTATAQRFLAAAMGLATETATEVKYALSRACTVRNLRFQCVAGTGGGTNTYTVRKNGVNTTITIAISNGATSGTDVAHTVTFAVGDLISFGVTKGAAPTTPQTNLSATLELV